MKASSATTKPLPFFSVFLLLLLLLPLSAVQATTSSSSSSGFGLCLNEAQACRDDGTCEDCLGSWALDSSSEDCADTYDADGILAPATSTSTSSSSGTTTTTTSTGTGGCVASGVVHCCGFDDGTAETCMQNDLMVEYWTCIMEGLSPAGESCTIGDMPCYVEQEETEAEINQESTNGVAAAAGRDGRVTLAAKGGVALLAGFVISTAAATGML